MKIALQFWPSSRLIISYGERRVVWLTAKGYFRCLYYWLTVRAKRKGSVIKQLLNRDDFSFYINPGGINADSRIDRESLWKNYSKYEVHVIFGFYCLIRVCEIPDISVLRIRKNNISFPFYGLTNIARIISDVLNRSVIECCMGCNFSTLRDSLFFAFKRDCCVSLKR